VDILTGLTGWTGYKEIFESKRYKPAACGYKLVPNGYILVSIRYYLVPGSPGLNKAWYKNESNRY
jgi:hypothetical protein